MNKEFYLILLLLGIILLGIVLIVRLINHNKKQQSDFSNIIKYEQKQSQQWQDQYTTLFTEVEQEDERQKEVAKRTNEEVKSIIDYGIDKLEKYSTRKLWCHYYTWRNWQR